MKIEKHNTKTVKMKINVQILKEMIPERNGFFLVKFTLKFTCNPLLQV